MTSEEDRFRERVREGLTPWGIALAAAGAGVATYALLSLSITVYFRFLSVTANSIAMPLIAVAVAVSVHWTRSRKAAVLTAAAVPPVAVIVAFVVGRGPYIAANLGLSQEVGRGLLALVPGAVCAGVVAALLPRDVPQEWRT
jgi:hypothetical protein